MKYWKVDTPNNNPVYYAEENKQTIIDLYNKIFITPTITELTKEQYDFVQWQKEIQAKADKGQEVQNAIELNEAFRSYVQVMIYNVDFLIKGNQKDMILYPNVPIHQQNEEKHMKEYKAYINLYRSIVTFERHIAIATNIDPNHPVSFPNRQSMENVISHIKANEPELWTDIAKMLKVEEAYEAKEAVDAWIAIEQAANPHINMHPTTDTDSHIVDAVVSGGT